MGTLLTSTNNKLIYGLLGKPVHSDWVQGQWLYFEYTFANTDPMEYLSGRVVYEYGDITGGTPFSPTLSRTAYVAHSGYTDNGDGTSTLILKTQIDFIARGGHGAWAYESGTFTYYSVNWRIKVTDGNGTLLYYKGVSAFTLRVYIGSEEATKNVTSIHEYTYDDDNDVFTAGGSFPRTEIITATIAWTPSTNTLTIT